MIKGKYVVFRYRHGNHSFLKTTIPGVSDVENANSKEKTFH